MTVHFLKPALQIQDIYEFTQRQQIRMKQIDGKAAYPVYTSRRPARQNDLLNNGSVYWIVKNHIQCRQAIHDILEIPGENGEKPAYVLLCDPQLIRTWPQPQRAFQGWRYLEPAKAPADIGPVRAEDTPPPPDMAKLLLEAGLL